jgi:hypothetical protein
MDTRTDFRKLRRMYIMLRLQRAMNRLAYSGSKQEALVARRWVYAWGGALGDLQFAQVESRLASARAY